MRSASSARWRAASSSTSRRARGPSACTPAGRRKPASAPSTSRGTEGDWARLTDGFGEEWVANGIAFKPYACGTMTQPYVDCARRLAKKVDVDSIVEVVCEVGEGT